MKVLPVITRELRAQARQPFTHWLRALSVVALLCGAFIFISDNAGEANSGGALFGLMHLMGYCIIWLLVPLGAADCISRERREGTLGLLFLTPLKAAHIVIAKGMAHGLRAGTLVVAFIPALMIPFLLGGVMWPQVVISAAVNFSAVCWCLAAALVASALARHTGRAMSLAMGLTLGGFVFYPWIVGAILGINSQSTWTNGYSQSGYDFLVGFSVVGNSVHWQQVLMIFKPVQIFTAVGMATVISFAGLVASVLFAANRIRQSWREEPPSARVQHIEKVMCQPVVAVGFFRWWMRRRLERNPIGWLEQRRWSGRMLTWGWFAIIISVYSAVLDRRFFRGSDMESFIGWLLAISMAASAAGSFRRERETGMLELLLVSPLTTRQIIISRLIGLWGQFLPSIVTLLAIWEYFTRIVHRGYRSGDSAMAEIAFFAVTFLVIPVIGLSFSIQCRHFLSALLLTLGGAVIGPALLSLVVKFLQWSLGSESDYFGWWEGTIGSTCFFQLFTALGLLIRLHQKLEQRSFPLERVAG